jgi:hypothetical protein
VSETTWTLPEGEPDTKRGRRRMLVRSAVLVAFALFVLAGLFGFLGVRTAHARATADTGYQVELTYPRITRPALAITFAVTITGLEEVAGDVTVRIRSNYLAMFDENGMSPTPVEETDDGEWATWLYDHPPDGVLEVSLDTRVEPGVQWGRDGAVVVQVGSEAVRIDFHTWVAP